MTLVIVCDFFFLQTISFVIGLSSFNKLLPNVVFFNLLIASEQENNLQGNKITNSGQSYTQLTVVRIEAIQLSRQFNSSVLLLYLVDIDIRFIIDISKSII